MANNLFFLVMKKPSKTLSYALSVYHACFCLFVTSSNIKETSLHEKNVSFFGITASPVNDSLLSLTSFCKKKQIKKATGNVITLKPNQKSAKLFLIKSYYINVLP